MAASISSREDARSLVEAIGRRLGFIHPDTYAAMSAWDRAAHEEVRAAIESMQGILGQSVTTLSQSLYSSDVRFLFEMLQNCEDNHYRNATARNEPPSVLFQLHPDHIVVECNEDGFTRANLEAICDVGKSSKVGSQGYIGEKGIGFKSVFTVAHKAVIQSGHLSFSFRHNRGESGLGMILPLWEDGLSPVQAGKTRITLWLRQDDDARDVFARVREQTDTLHEEMLLFMEKLKVVIVEIYKTDGTLEISSTYTCDTTRGDIVETLRTDIDDNGNRRETAKKFFCTKYTVSELPGSDDRGTMSNIILAFPLHSNCVPRVANQWLFSFLPVAPVGFKFVLQADFICSANREAIDTTSPWNRALSKSIPSAFTAAVLKMCEHNTLQYQWMRYLPFTDDGNAWSTFWTSVVTEISASIQNTPVLRPASGGPLRRIGEMRDHSIDSLDQDSLPLFPDILPEVYLSQNYTYPDLDILNQVGLEVTSWHPFILERIQADLNSSASRMKTFSDASWHTRAALMLQPPFDEGWDHITGDLKRMELLPLRTGRWHAIADGEAYYATLDGLTIPDGLALNIIDPSAASHPERKRLFDRMGVQTASVELVRRLITERYVPTIRTISRRMSIMDLHFMYQTHAESSHDPETLNVVIATSDSGFARPTSTDVYIPSTEDLSPAQLLRSTLAGTGPDDGAPGHQITLLHLDYLRNVPTRPTSSCPAWIDWLHVSVGIRRDLRIKAKDSNELSPELLYVAQYRPTKFMLLLNHLWNSQGAEISQNHATVSRLREVEVRCSTSEQSRQLHETYLPFQSNMALADRFLLQEEDCFPWLEIDGQPEDTVQLTDWEQLASDLEFGLPDSELDLALAVLQSITSFSAGDRTERGYSYIGVDGSTGSARHRKLYDLYVFINAQVQSSADRVAAVEEVSTVFLNDYPIFIPTAQDGELGALWAAVNECVWEAPVSRPNTMHAVKEFYSERPSEHDSSLSQTVLRSFFCQILEISVWSWENTINEIESERESEDPDFDRILELYSCLQIYVGRLPSSDEDVDDVRATFAESPLIYNPLGGQHAAWHASADCIWTAATNIPGKTAINNGGDYDSLEELFLNVVGVQRMTAKMLYDKLRGPSPDISLEELKGDLREFNAFLARAEGDHDGESLDPQELRNNGIFPIKRPSGEVIRLTATDQFAIPDRAPLAQCFRDQVSYLDFDLADIRGLDPFIQLVGLGDRYLSTATKEVFSADRASSRPISEARRDIRRKAGALTRIAVLCGSPRVVNGCEDLFRQLQDCVTLETARMHTVVHLTLPGNHSILPAEKDGGNGVLIDENAEGLTIFVPRKRSDREACFQTKLARYLLEWIMSDANTNITRSDAVEAGRSPGPDIVHVVQALLNAEACGLRGILEENGIPSIDSQYDDDFEDDDDETPEEDPEPELAGDDNEASQEPNTNTVSVASVRSQVEQRFLREPNSRVERGHAVQTPVPESDTEDDPILTPAHSSTAISLDNRPHIRSISPTIVARSHGFRGRAAGPSVQLIPDEESGPTPQYGPAFAVEEHTPYRQLLEHVVGKARQFTFPSQGAFDMSGLANALSNDGDNDPAVGLPFLRDFARLERDKMVGAAGELFVFELLGSLDPPLPEFSMSNWQSNIRGYARAHPDHSDITRWHGRETADLTYKDETGAFTSILADKGYLNGYDIDRLRSSKPTYYLEVKSTPYLYETSFFMSRFQYKRMQDFSQSVPGQDLDLDHIYVILRVFRLGKDDVSMRVLVDPEGMRRRGELNFEAESWRVQPFAG